MVEGRVHAELVVRAAVAEVQASGDGEVGLERHGELIQETFASRGGMGDEDAGLRRIVDTVGGIDQFPHLQEGGPHGSLSTGNGGAAITVVEQLVHDHGASEAQQTELDPANVQQARVGLVDDVKLVDLVLARSKLLQDAYILTCAPDGVDGNGQGVGLVDKGRQLGQG